MAGRILFDALSPALDDDANPISGTYIYFRQAGTTTALDVYTTNELNIAHPNPMRSDDAGRTDQVWAPDAAVYDIVWKDGDGADIKTLYNVGAVPNGGVSASARLDGYAIPITDETNTITASTDTPAFTMHALFDWVALDVMGGLNVAQTSGAVVTFQIKVNGVNMLSTPVTIDNNETFSDTAGTPPVLALTEWDRGDRLDFYITQIGDGTAIGAKVYIPGYPRA